MIQPTVGRIVWYHPYQDEPKEFVCDKSDVCAAIIAHVWSDTCVNLAVFDANGNQHNRTSVLLVQDGNPQPDYGFCEWMPYQKGQAAKTEALEKQIAGE
jgi:hypothetical protein